MGNARRRRDGERTAQPCAQVMYGAVEDATDQAAIHHVMKATHDNLITLAGEARRSGVIWHQYDAKQGLAILDALEPGDEDFPGLNGDRDVSAEREMLRTFLREHEAGMLIVAMVDIDPLVAAAAMS